jgi:hypothetical protein
VAEATVDVHAVDVHTVIEWHWLRDVTVLAACPRSSNPPHGKRRHRDDR